MGMQQSCYLDTTKMIQSIVLCCKDLDIRVTSVFTCAVKFVAIVAVVVAGGRHLKGLSMADLDAIADFSGPVHTPGLLILRRVS